MALIVIRTDGGPSIGAGHVRRCLALASPFRQGGWRVGFAATEEAFQSITALGDADVEALLLPPSLSAEEEASFLRKRWPEKAEIFVVDHYYRDQVFERMCRSWARRIVVLDDLANRKHDADLLLDAAGRVRAYQSLVPADCLLLTGPKYAVIDPSFRAARASALARRRSAEVKRILISFGQIDPPNATMRAIRAVERLNFAGEIDVVLGKAASHLAQIRAVAGSRLRVLTDVEDMPDLISRSDLAIGAAGVSAWERCCLGLPSVSLLQADNQQYAVEVLSDAGATIFVGPLDSGLEERIEAAIRRLIGSPEVRQTMAGAASALVDGRGGQRVMIAAVAPEPIAGDKCASLRLAEPEDEDWLFALQNEKETRAFARRPESPSRDEHAQWMRATLANKDRLLTIVEYDGRPVGMLRLDRMPEIDGLRRFEISIAVHPSEHRKGLGNSALLLARRLFPAAAIDATVLAANTASGALFRRAGYRYMGGELFRQDPC